MSLNETKDHQTREEMKEILEKIMLPEDTKKNVLIAIENLENGDLEELFNKIKNLNK